MPDITLLTPLEQTLKAPGLSHKPTNTFHSYTTGELESIGKLSWSEDQTNTRGKTRPTETQTMTRSIKTQN